MFLKLLFIIFSPDPRIYVTDGFFFPAGKFRIEFVALLIKSISLLGMHFHSSSVPDSVLCPVPFVPLLHLSYF